MHPNLYLKITLVLLAVGIHSCAVTNSPESSPSMVTEMEISETLFPLPSKTAFKKTEPKPRTQILTIHFDFGKWEIRSQDYPQLGELGKALQRRGLVQGGLVNAMIEIGAYTDNVGNRSHNQWLSQQRANAVRNFLISHYGIDGSRLKAKGYGEDNPLATNRTSAGRAANRRVEVRRVD